jgi:hypothetical protein
MLEGAWWLMASPSEEGHPFRRGEYRNMFEEKIREKEGPGARGVSYMTAAKIEPCSPLPFLVPSHAAT